MESERTMAGIGEIRVPIHFEITDASRAILKDVFTEVIREHNSEEALLPAGEWEELASVQRNDIYAMKDRMVRHLNAEVEAFYREHPELKIEYRFQVEAVRR